jgi:uncharacterized protein involved in exopolysaccharide biosynthesis/Mrp family chromosome partitioning ATPase
MSLEYKKGIKTPGEDATEIDAGWPSDSVNLGDLAGGVVRRKTWIAGTALACVILTAGYLATVKPTYTSTAQVYVDPRDRPMPKEDRGEQSNVPGDGLLLVESQLKIITSGEVLARVVHDMALREDPEFNGRGGFVSGIKAMFGLGQSGDPELAALRRLHLLTSAKRNERSFVIDISVSANTPQRATELTNAVVSTYLEEQVNANSAFNRRFSEAIAAQLERMRDAVSQSEQAIVAYKAAHNLIGGRDRLVTDQELDEANTQLTNAKARLNEAQARVKLIESIESGSASLESLPEAVQSGAIVQLRARAMDVSRDEAQLAQIAGPNHPALLAVRAQVKDVQSGIKNEVKLIAQAVRNVATSEHINVQSLQARFDSLKVLAQANEKAIVPLRELQRKAESNRSVYETYLAKAKAASEQQTIDNTNIRLISRAIPPDRQSWPPTLALMSAALFGGLFLGTLLALLGDVASRRNSRPPEPSPTSEKVEIPVVQARKCSDGEDQEKLSRLGADLLAASASRCLLLVRTSQDAALDLVALELARAVDDARRKAVVVDADLRKHAVTSRLGYHRHLGLRDLLTGRASIQEAMHPLGQTGIVIIPVGMAALAPPDQQTRSSLAVALHQARQVGHVIIDGGELGKTSSEFGLYAMVDEVVFLETVRSDSASDVSVLVDILRRRQIAAKVVYIDPAVQTLAA